MNKPKPDPMLLKLAADNRSVKLDQLVTAGKITPAVREKLKGVFIGKDNAALALSLSAGTADEFDAIVAALAENNPVKTGEMTGAQVHGDTVTLSDGSKGDNPLLADAQRRAKKEYVK